MSPDLIKSIFQPDPPQPFKRRIGAYRHLLILSGVVLFLDQLTKLWICLELPNNTYGPPRHIEVIPGFFNLVRVGNTGAGLIGNLLNITDTAGTESATALFTTFKTATQVGKFGIKIRVNGANRWILCTDTAPTA